MSTRTKNIDLYDLDVEWTDAQREVAQRVRSFVDAEVLPRMVECHYLEVFPRELIAPIGKLGILTQYLAGELDPTAFGLVMRELERGGSPVRSLLSVQSGLVMHPIQRFGSDEQRAQWLTPLSTFEAVGCFALTEPGSGSNPASMETFAERLPGGYRITGHKRWVTNGTLAQVAVVWAKVDDAICGFLVETDRPNLEVRPIVEKWSFRSSASAELELHGVEVPESALLPGATSLGRAMDCLNQARYSIAWGVVGAAQACLEETLEYLKQRTQFGGKPLASHQLIQNKLAWMAAELTGMTLIAKRLGELKARDAMQPAHVSLAKMNNCRKALEIARTCRELLGAQGILTESHVGRRMVDLETVITYEGTEHIHSLVLGQELTGIRAFS